MSACGACVCASLCARVCGCVGVCMGVGVCVGVWVGVGECDLLRPCASIVKCEVTPCCDALALPQLSDFPAFLAVHNRFEAWDCSWCVAGPLLGACVQRRAGAGACGLACVSRVMRVCGAVSAPPPPSSARPPCATREHRARPTVACPGPAVHRTPSSSSTLCARPLPPRRTGHCVLPRATRPTHLVRLHRALPWPCRASTRTLRTQHRLTVRHVPLGFALNLEGPPPLPEDQRDVHLALFGEALPARGCVVGLCVTVRLRACVGACPPA